MKHIHTFERFSKTERVNEDYRNTDPSLKEYVGKTVKAILEDDDGENSYVTIQFNDNTQMKITAYPLGSGGVGLVVESLNERIEYPEGVNEGHRPAKVKIPANVATVTKKIQKENPFKRGQEISDMIEANWADIIETAKNADDQEILRDELSKKEYVIDLCKKLNLDDFYFVGQIMKNYF